MAAYEELHGGFHNDAAGDGSIQSCADIGRASALDVVVHKGCTALFACCLHFLHVLQYVCTAMSAEKATSQG